MTFKRYVMTLQYAGTRYSGWQMQKNRPTVQGVLRESLQRICGEVPSVIGAGRTDAGVHAMGQVAHFSLRKAWAAERLKRALNAVLPGDIRVMRLRRVGEGFHAQREARRKRYEYRIYTGEVVSPFEQGYVLHLPYSLDAAAMDRAARMLEGRHDFTAFAAAGSGVRDRIRCVYSSRVSVRGRRIRYRVEAEGFLHHMVRNIVGTLVQIGTGDRDPEEIGTLLKSQDRRLAGPTAPPQGLYLVRVWY